MFETSVSINNNLCGKLVSSLEFPITFDERTKVISVPFFIADLTYKLWIVQLYIFTFVQL